MSQWWNMINDWIQSTSKAEEIAVADFERIWKAQGSGQSVAFLSIAVNTSATSLNDIEDLGLSVWTKQILVHKASHHWRVQENVEVKDVVEFRTPQTLEFGNPDAFDFGTTQPVRADDVATILDDWVLSLSSQCEHLALVVYGKQTMKTLRKHWKPPIPVVIIDLEVVSRLRCNSPAELTFVEAASTNGEIANVTKNLNHAGNQAYCLLLFLQVLARGESDEGIGKIHREMHPED